MCWREPSNRLVPLQLGPWTLVHRSLLLLALVHRSLQLLALALLVSICATAEHRYSNDWSQGSERVDNRQS